jgi:hypothetical protein
MVLFLTVLVTTVSPFSLRYPYPNYLLIVMESSYHIMIVNYQQECIQLCF